MNFIRWILPVSMGLLLSIMSGRASAQAPYQRPQTNPYGTPAFSPYLNLLRGGSNPAINYFGIVRPEFQTAQALRSLRGDVNANAADLAQTQNGLTATGHPVQFLNTTHYFFNTTGAGTGATGQRLGGGTAAAGFGTGTKPQGAGAGSPTPKR